MNFLKRTLTVERQIQGQTTSTTAVLSPKYESGRTIYLPDELVTMIAQHVERNGTLGGNGGSSHGPATS